MSIKQFIGKHNDGTSNEAAFQYFRKGNFYYSVKSLESGDKYGFCVPVNEIGDGSIYRNDKAITFTKWISAAIKNKTFVKTD